MNKKISLLFICVFIGACSSDMSELDAFIEETKRSTVGTVEPLPYYEPYQSYEYRADRNPFEPLDSLSKKQQSKADALPPNINPNRPPEPLESFPLDALLMVGTLEQEGKRWALIRDSDAKLHRVTLGNYMGKNFGKIVEVGPEHITLNETVKDSSDGWTDRTSELRIGD